MPAAKKIRAKKKNAPLRVFDKIYSGGILTRKVGKGAFIKDTQGRIIARQLTPFDLQEGFVRLIRDKRLITRLQNIMQAKFKRRREIEENLKKLEQNKREKEKRKKEADKTLKKEAKRLQVEAGLMTDSTKKPRKKISVIALARFNVLMQRALGARRTQKVKITKEVKALEPDIEKATSRKKRVEARQNLNNVAVRVEGGPFIAFDVNELNLAILTVRSTVLGNPKIKTGRLVRKLKEMGLNFDRGFVESEIRLMIKEQKIKSHPKISRKK